jgi:uncharacterized Tic20 family protein
MAKGPNIGREFPLEAKIIDATTRQFVAKTRAILATGFAIISIMALSICAIVALIRDDFGILALVWSIVAMPIGAIVTHYFGKEKANETNDYESPT